MRSRWSSCTLVVLGASLLVAAPAPSASAGAESGKKVTFLTRNLYLGADLAPAIGAILYGSDFDVLAAVGGVWADVHATDFPTRVRGLADEISSGKPDLVGLQEAVLWRIGDAFDPSPAEEVVYDFVGILLDELDRRGHPYEVVATSTGYDLEMPGFVSAAYDVADIRLTDRDVILARRGGSLKLSNVQTDHFDAAFEIPGLFATPYGWASVDCRAGDEEFRFVTAHLDNEDPDVRELQSLELVAGPCDTSLPVVLIGDFNSDGNGGSTEAAYLNVLDAGFFDAWTLTHPGDPGLTWGHDGLLSDPEPFQVDATLERIDFVLFRGGAISAYDADRLGEESEDRVGDLWPSDHAGVLATLRIR